MFRKFALVLLAVALTLDACQSANKNADSAVAPATHSYSTPPVVSQPAKIVASKPAPTTDLGLLLNGWAGPVVGTALDDSDRQKEQQAEKRAFNAPVGQQVTWNNPGNGTSGTIAPVRDGYAPSGAYCRDFQQTVTIGGQQKKGQDKACQQPDGSWKIAL